MATRNTRTPKRPPLVRTPSRHLAKTTEARQFWEPLWGWVGGLFLGATTLVWAYLGSQIQLGNADQLINVYLLDDPSSAQASQLPAAHTFLAKMPLLWLVHAMGSTRAAFTLVTVLTVLATIGALMVILYKIIRQPLLFGIVCMALASILLLVPAQPYPGVLLPVNMAMLTTRNIEYILFMASIVLVARQRVIELKAWKLWAAAALAAALIASDKLFLVFYIGGAALTLAAYGLMRQHAVARFAAMWLACGLAGGVLAAAVSAVVGSLLFHIVGTSVTPYNLTPSWHSLLSGSAYAVLGLLTNLGLNPTTAPAGIGGLVGQHVAQLAGWGGAALLLNAAILVGVAGFSGRFVWRSRRLREDKQKVAWPQLLFIGLLNTTLVATVAFVVANHYYPVDARYLTIGFFAAAVGLALAVGEWSWLVARRGVVLPVLMVGIVSAGILGWQVYSAEARALAPTAASNSLVAAALRQHGASLLVGDYWRVLPTQLLGGNRFRSLPLEDCAQPRAVLSNAILSAGFRKQPFAYLLSFSNHSADFPNCTLDEVVSAFGQPNKSVVISGTRDDPKELLLFYDGGVVPVGTGYKVPAATISPVNLGQLTAPACPTGQTIVSVMAHQDDDLLFMNPDHMHNIQKGDCMRNIYLTAGDAGSGQLYWIGREKGSEAAYDVMLGGKKHLWNDQVVRLPGGQQAIVATPDNTSRVSLIFMRLPDGNADGSGFGATNFQSLDKLQKGKVAAIRTVNKQSTYTRDDLIGALERLMEFYTPAEIDTQAPLNLGKRFSDHSDHIAAGQFAKAAFERYQANSPMSIIKYYIGYPIHGYDPNVFGEDYQNKSAAFFAYSAYDSGACTTFASCSNHSVYGEYLQRQYQYAPAK